jgi:hypothetical protein
MSLVRAWRTLTWKHWAWATVIPILIGITIPLQGFDTNWYWARERILYHVPWFLFFSYTFLLAIVLAESPANPEAQTPFGRYLLALGAATVLCVAALGAFPELVKAAPTQIVAGQTLLKKAQGTPEEQSRARRINAMLGFSHVIVHGWLATFIYVRLRGARLAARALADAELERAEAQRRLAAAQLVAVQARIDPAFILQTLEHVGRTYAVDPPRADILLDDFIAFLRDAIPRLRTDEGAELHHA